MNFWHAATNPRMQCCIRIRWPPNQITNLIQLYRDNPCLWNKEDPLYLDYCARRTAYRNIYEELKDCVSNINLIEVIVKLREVRKYYVNELKKIAEAKHDGCEYESRYGWFDDIHDFLYQHLHVDELADVEVVGSTYSSNYCSDVTPSPRSRSGLSDVCLSSVSTKNSQMQRLDLHISASNTTQLIKSTNSRLTELKSCDQFDLFAKGVACRLRRMDPEVAAEAQIEIQQILTDFDDAAAAAVSESNDSRDDSYTQEDCNCEVIMPFSRDKCFMNQDSNTNFTV